MKFDMLCKMVLNEADSMEDVNELNELEAGGSDIGTDVPSTDADLGLDEVSGPVIPETNEEKVAWLLSLGKMSPDQARKLAAQEDTFNLFWELKHEQSQDSIVPDVMPDELETDLPSGEDVSDIEPQLDAEKSLKAQEEEDFELPDDNNV